MEPGKHFMLGNHALAEGAIAAGCDFYAGYPITPSSEIMERISSRFEHMADRYFVQMEDEIGSIAAVIGASWAGAKAMTATSGPGFALMLENLSYAYATEVPLVVVNAMRSGPSTGQSTYPAQQDVYQAKYGAHGDYEVIALAPWSVQEMYDMAIQAFNLAETYRQPVILLPDGEIAHMREQIEIPDPSTIKTVYRKRPDYENSQYEKTNYPPFMPASDDDPVPPMPLFGDGAEIRVTGSAHDEFGNRNYAPDIHSRMVQRQINKVRKNRRRILDLQIDLEDQAKVAVVAIGSAARAAYGAITRARAQGHKISFIRPKTVWPFPDDELEEISEEVEKFLVVEMNMGKLSREVERAVGRKNVETMPVFGGIIPRENSILSRLTKLV